MAVAEVDQPRRGAERSLLRERTNDLAEDSLALAGESRIFIGKAEILSAYLRDSLERLKLGEALAVAKVHEAERNLKLAIAEHLKVCTELHEAEQVTEHLTSVFGKFDHDVLELSGAIAAAAERAGYQHLHKALKLRVQHPSQEAR